MPLRWNLFSFSKLHEIEQFKSCMEATPAKVSGTLILSVIDKLTSFGQREFATAIHSIYKGK